MLQAIELIKEYRTGEIVSVALSNININVEKGEFLSVLGPSGSGKTSLVNTLGMLDMPTTGEIIINGQKSKGLNNKERLTLRRKELGYIFSDPKLIDELTIYENIELPLLYQKVNRKVRAERIHYLLGEMNLLHLKKQFPIDLSGIQQQKVSIARAIANKPSLILADEPTGNLNSANGDEILNILSRINDDGTTLIVFTHSERVAEKGQRILQMFDGHLVMDSALK